MLTACPPSSDNDLIRPIHELGTSLAAPGGELPADAAQLRFARAGETADGRGWLGYAYFWEAPAVCYRPLYFEEPNLERYGHSAGNLLQPMVSGAHFYAAVGALPIKMVLARPWTSAYPLGYARPGSKAPWERSR